MGSHCYCTAQILKNDQMYGSVLRDNARDLVCLPTERLLILDNSISRVIHEPKQGLKETWNTIGCSVKCTIFSLKLPHTLPCALSNMAGYAFAGRLTVNEN